MEIKFDVIVAERILLKVWPLFFTYLLRNTVMEIE